jgi:hypothetical protein
LFVFHARLLANLFLSAPPTSGALVLEGEGGKVVCQHTTTHHSTHAFLMFESFLYFCNHSRAPFSPKRNGTCYEYLGLDDMSMQSRKSMIRPDLTEFEVQEIREAFNLCVLLLELYVPKF